MNGPRPYPTDLEWLLSLGVTMEEAAHRVGRTIGVITAELADTRRARSEEDGGEHT